MKRCTRILLIVLVIVAHGGFASTKNAKDLLWKLAREYTRIHIVRDNRTTLFKPDLRVLIGTTQAELFSIMGLPARCKQPCSGPGEYYFEFFYLPDDEWTMGGGPNLVVKIDKELTVKSAYWLETR